MDYTNIMKSACLNELEKIAGMSRLGKRPMHIDTLLKRSKKIKKLGDITKVAVSGPISALGIAGGLYGTYKAHQFYRHARRRLQGEAEYHYNNI